MFLLQMSGFPGSGKSTVAQKIMKLTGAVVLDRDIIKTSLLEAGIEPSKAAKVSYDQTYDLAAFYLKMNVPVIIDTPCFYDEILNRGISLAKENLVKYKYILCTVDHVNIINERLKTRTTMMSQIEKTTEESFKLAMTKVKKPSEDVLILDTSDDSDDDEIILKYLVK